MAVEVATEVEAVATEVEAVATVAEAEATVAEAEATVAEAEAISGAEAEAISGAVAVTSEEVADILAEDRCASVVAPRTTEGATLEVEILVVEILEEGPSIVVDRSRTSMEAIIFREVT